MEGISVGKRTVTLFQEVWAHGAGRYSKARGSNWDYLVGEIVPKVVVFSPQ
jgi:hypothetical protein